MRRRTTSALAALKSMLKSTMVPSRSKITALIVNVDQPGFDSKFRGCWLHKMIYGFYEQCDGKLIEDGNCKIKKGLA